MGVKNKTGGNKAKKQGRKHVAIPTTRKVRFSEDPCEVYACCEKMLGNSTCRVKCIDGKTRRCIIRKKFKGRHKSDNMVTIGTWLLVGIRDYETGNSNDTPENCDLIEVYRNNEKDDLMQNQPDKMWKLFQGIGTSSQSNDHVDDEQDIGIDITNKEIDTTFLDSLNIDGIDEETENTITFDDNTEIDIDDI
jgi:initiation factor 1A|tara:strand:- start:405 stop:980 length:576 start_codon:yes stop_codon:yes gene_type:complete